MSNVDDLIQKLGQLLEQPPSVRSAMALRQVMTTANVTLLLQGYELLKKQEAKSRFRVSQLEDALDQTRTVVEALEKQTSATVQKLTKLEC